MQTRSARLSIGAVDDERITAMQKTNPRTVDTLGLMSIVATVLAMLPAGVAFGQYSNTIVGQDGYPRQTGTMQHHGLFGERSFGEPLEKPRGWSLFKNGVRYGPSGNVLGIDRTAGNSLFSDRTNRQLYGGPYRDKPDDVIRRTPWPTVDAVTVVNPDEVGRPMPPPTSRRAPTDALEPERPGQGLPPEEMPMRTPSRMPLQPPLPPSEDAWFRSPAGGNPMDALAAPHWEPVPMAGSDVPEPDRSIVAGTGREAIPRQAQPRPRMEAFTRADARRAQMEISLATRLRQNAAIRDSGDLRVSMRGDTAVLEGTVATQQDADLAERALLMDPRIGTVDNQLRVGQPSQPPQQ